MKISVEMTGDFYEHKDLIQHSLNGQLYYSMMHEAKNEIRNRLKHGDDVTDQEERFLDNIFDTLTVDEI